MAADVKKSLDLVAAGFGVQLKEHGATPKGVLWNDAEGQKLRFELLIGVMEGDISKEGLSINDLGCGYGAFFDFLEKTTPMVGWRFFGYDISEDMIKSAKTRVSDPRAAFQKSAAASQKADYSFASGTFNMLGTASDADWTRFVKESLLDLWAQSAKGLAFNLLDPARKKKREPWLYYPDIDDVLNFCRAKLSPKAKLVDSRPLEEWTILIRRD